MKNHLKLLITKLNFFLFLFIVSCLSNSNSAQKTKEIYVTKVFDGDTIEISTGERVRYIGIDAPELHIRDNDDWVEVKEPYAVEAYERNKSLVLGKKVKLVFDKEKKDKYNRLLCYVFVDDKFINEILLSEGLAFLYLREPNTLYKERLIKAFKEAFLKRKNLYSNIFKPSELNYMLGNTGWYSGKVRNIIMGNRSAEIITDHMIIETSKSFIKKHQIQYGINIYAYGKLLKKRGRFYMRTEKFSHLFKD